MNRKSLLVAIVPFFFTAACAVDRDMSDDEGQQGGTEQAEKWGRDDDPAIFGPGMKRKLTELPDQGEAAVIPWAGSYWPTYQDNINHKWAGAGTDSPAKKYEKAFGGSNVEDAVSKYHGIDSRTSDKVCKTSADCDASLDQTCAIREGKSEGRCIAKWFGICHAWAPGAILMAEPKKEVVRNGVTFKVQDIKALATLVHNRTTSKFVSLRCNKNDGKGEIRYDSAGRPIEDDKECKDTNAATYHLLLTNYLGIQKASFVEDRTMDYQVWNQPLRGYKVISKKEVTIAEANDLIGVTATGGTTVKKEAAVVKDAWQHFGSFDVTPGSTYRVSMTGDGDGDLHVRFGAEPDAAKYDCRPYDSGSSEVCTGTVPAGVTKLFVSVNGYAEKSAVKLDITYGAQKPTKYEFNADAVKLFYYKTDVQYISESPSSQDGNLASTIDRYTHTDHYEYILEVNGAGEVIGGEWVGASKKAHPDFVWLPTGVAGTSVAGGAITYANVKSILDESTSTVPGTGTGGTDKTVNETGTIAKGEVKQYGPYKVAAGASLVATTSGTGGDVDLYVRKGSAPTTSTYDCRPYKNGSNETCTVAGGSDVFVHVRGYATTSTFKLDVKYKAAN